MLALPHHQSSPLQRSDGLRSVLLPAVSSCLTFPRRVGDRRGQAGVNMGLVPYWTRGMKLLKSTLQRRPVPPEPTLGRTVWCSAGSAGMMERLERCLASQLVGRFSCSWKQAYSPACRCSSGHCRSLFITFLKPQPLIPLSATAEEGPRGSLETFSDCLWGCVIWC